MAQLELHDLTVFYPGQETPALRGVTASLEAGEFVTLCGQSGSGKSTLIQMLNGLLRPTGGQVLLDGKALELTAREFELLHTFAAAPGRVFTREMLLAKLWGYDFYGDERVVDSHIKNLRHKLGAGYIETVRGVGYRAGKTAR